MCVARTSRNTWHHSKNSLSTQKNVNMSRLCCPRHFLALHCGRVSCGMFSTPVPLLGVLPWRCSRIGFRYPWQGKLRRKACLAKWVHLSLIHLQGDCNIYASFEMQRMQDLRPVESQAVCTMTGVRRSEKLCRYAGRVIYEIYKCDAPWPGNEWCKLESTKKPAHEFNIQIAKRIQSELEMKERIVWKHSWTGELFFSVLTVVVPQLQDVSVLENSPLFFSLQRAPHFDEVVVSFQELEFAIRVTYLSTVEHVARCNIAEKRRSLRQPVC